MAEIEDALEKLGGKAFDFNIAGHLIQSHLLNVREELSVDRLAKDYEGTMAYPSALKTATFALSVDTIDGLPFFTALENNSDQTALARFKKAQNFYRQVVQAWFEEYERKAEKEAEALENLKKKISETLSKTTGEILKERLICDFWLKALDPLSREYVLVERFCKEADRKQRLEVLQDALSGLESFIDYRAWAQTYKPQETPQKTAPKPVEIDPSKIDRLANMKPVDPSKQEEALEKLAKIKEALERRK